MKEVMFLLSFLSVPYVIGLITNKGLRLHQENDFGNSWYLGLVVIALIGIFYILVHLIGNLIM